MPSNRHRMHRASARPSRGNPTRRSPRAASPAVPCGATPTCTPQLPAREVRSARRVVPGRRRRERVAAVAKGRQSRSRGGNMQSASDTPSSHWWALLCPADQTGSRAQLRPQGLPEHRGCRRAQSFWGLRTSQNVSRARRHSGARGSSDSSSVRWCSCSATSCPWPGSTILPRRGKNRRMHALIVRGARRRRDHRRGSSTPPPNRLRQRRPRCGRAQTESRRNHWSPRTWGTWFACWRTTSGPPARKRAAKGCVQARWRSPLAVVVVRPAFILGSAGRQAHAGTTGTDEPGRAGARSCLPCCPRTSNASWRPSSVRCTG